MASGKNKLFQATMTVTLVIFASKAVGMIRDVILAGFLGTTASGDAYSAAYSLFYVPILLFTSCVTSTLIPLYVDAKNKSGRRAADRFASNCISLFAVLSFVVGVLMMWLAAPLMRLTSPGFNAEKLTLAVSLARIMMPSLVFVVLSVVMASILNANEHYIAAQLTGFPLSFAMIIAVLAFAPRFGLNAIAWGVFAAGILQMLVLVPPLQRSMRYHMRIRVKDKRFKRMMLLALPAMLSMAVNELNHLVSKAITSFQSDGDTVSMDWAFRLITFATGVLAVPITTVMFSKLSQHAAEGDRRALTQVLNQSVETLTMILTPIAVVGSVLSTDIIRLVYERGSFDQSSVNVTSGVFLFYLIGLVGFGLRDVYNRAFNALQDTRTPLYVSIGTVLLNGLLSVILARWMGVNGLALATTISCAVGAVALLTLLRRKLGRMGMRTTGRELLKMVAAALLTLIVALVLENIMPYAVGKLSVLVRLVVITGVSMGAYFGVLVLLKTRQLSFLKGLLRRK